MGGIGGGDGDAGGELYLDRVRSGPPDRLVEARASARAAVAAIRPLDDLEATHQLLTLEWIDSGEPLWRVTKPDVPAVHLVSYFPLLDLEARKVLLGDHRLSGRWLPAGGHVEPHEDPWETVVRETREELAIDAVPHPSFGTAPLLVTRTETVGPGSHLDVSLWYVLQGSTGMDLQPDPSEFVEARWWYLDEAAQLTRTDPHLARFLRKLSPPTTSAQR